MKKKWFRKWEFSQTTISQSKTGWVVEIESRVTGTQTGGRYLVPFSVIPAERDPEEFINHTCTNFDVIVTATYDSKTKVLRRSHEVR